ncbi:MAG TPA: sugar nucleotide-binding protein, partial [Caldimonas sp.]|nr:sugar nucleotide-binding protein [Caldimonas sp.]
MKILLLGKDGQVGWELQRALAPLGDVVALGRGDGDLRHPDALAAAVRTVAPQWIVNVAAYTAVDRAET